MVLIRNNNLKLKSDNTRICSRHFEGGEKLSPNHLPSIFPWSKENKQRRPLQRICEETGVEKGRREGCCIKVRRCLADALDAAASPGTSEEVSEGREIECVVNVESQEDVEQSSKSGNRDDLEKSKIENDQLLAELKRVSHELEKVKAANIGLQQENYKLKNAKFDIAKYKESDRDIAFYTGFPNWDTFILCYDMIKDSTSGIMYCQNKQRSGKGENVIGRPRSLSKFEEFTLVMLRLRLGLFEKDLAHRFGISESTVSNIFRTWMHFLRHEFQGFVSFPSRSLLLDKMPKIFKELYPKTVIIIDAVEFRMESPSALDFQSACYSSYKGTTTMKGLVGISPLGVVSFLSDLYTGSISDKELTKSSGLYEFLCHGDDVMADKGFDIKDDLAKYGVTLNIPAFLKGKMQFSKEQTEHNKKIASLRIHVERAIERIKNWHIFDSRLPICLAPVASEIFVVVGALTNFQPPLID